MAKHYAGARIHALRKAHNLTQVEMAKQLDLSTSYLNQLENDQRPLTVTALMLFTARFDVDASYFSPDRDIHLISELRGLFPDVDDYELADLAERYPSVISRLRELPAASSPAETAQHSSFEKVREFFYRAHNYIDTLDVLGEKLSERLGDKIMRLTRLATILDRDLGVHVRFGHTNDGARRHFEPSTRQLFLRTGLSDAQLCFEMAMQYCQLAHADILEQLVSELDEESRLIATFGLAQYFAAAVTMPYTAFLETAEHTRYDIDRIASRFGTGFETTAQRLATLQRPGNKGIPFIFIRTDRAGNISKRQSATDFHFSRSGGTCPLWVVHRAFETPNRITRQVASMPDGRTYLWIARHVQGEVKSFGSVRKEFTVGLGCDSVHADSLIYSDSLALSAQSATPIGPGCTLCPRTACPQRAFPQSGTSTRIDLNITSDSVYDTIR